MKRNQSCSSINRNQACYQLLLSETDACLHEIDLDGRLISMYPLALQSSDLSFDDVRNCSYSDLFDQNDRAFLNDLLDQAIQGDAFEYEFSFELDGDTRLFESSFMPITDKQGQIVKLAGFTRNFSAQMKATLEHEQSLDRLRNLVDTIDGIVWEADAISYQFLTINQFAVRLLGYPSEVFKSTNFWLDKMHPVDRAWVPDYCDKCREEGPSSYQIEYRMIAADGRAVWLRDLKSTGFDNQYRRILRGIMVDITAQKELEEARNAAEKRFRSFFMESPIGITIDDVETGLVVDINPAFERIMGRNVEELNRIGWQAITHPDDMEKETPYFERLEKREISSYQMEKRFIKPDNSVLFTDLSVTILDGDGFSNRPVYLVTLQDTTERVEAEERFRDMVNAIDGIVWERTEGSVQMNFVSQQVVNLLGYSAEKLTNPRFWLRLIHPEDRKRALDYSRECVNSELKQYQQEYRMIAGDGRTLWFRDSVTVTREVGKRFLLRGIVVDITEQRKVESRFSAVFMSATLGLALTDSESNVLLDINPAYARIVGRDIQEIKKLGWQAMTHPDDLKDDERNLQLIREGEISDYSMIKRFIKPDGTLVWTEVSVIPIDTGSLAAEPQYLTILNDITDSRESMIRLKESKAHYKDLVNAIDGIVWEADAFSTEYTYVSGQAERFLGYPVEDWLSPGFWVEKIHPEDRRRVVEYRARCSDEGFNCYELEYRFIKCDGQSLWVRDMVSVTRDEDSYRLRGVIIDLTERKQAEMELRESNSRIHGIVDNVVNGIVTIDEQGIIESFNSAARTMFGYSEEEIIGKNVETLMPASQAEKHQGYVDNYLRTGEGTIIDIRPREVMALTRDGISFPVELAVSEMSVGERKLFIGVLIDLTERKKAEEKLSHQASHDSLTGLINRREFELRADRLIASFQQGQDEHALCLVDLDQFKVINDTCGHIAGDELLRQLSRKLQTLVRHRDTLGRLGGDEFGILIEHCSLEQAQRVTSLLLEAIEAYEFVWEGRSLRVSASVGLVALSDTVSSFTDLLKQADQARYMAKDLGRNRIHIYRDEDNELDKRRSEMEWVARINEALEFDHFVLYAQQIKSLKNSAGSQLHYEMLIRMRDNDGNIIPPGAFLPAAERYGLMGKLDRWVIEHVLELLTDNPSFVDKVHCVSINLSGQSVTCADFLGFIVAQLKKCSFGADKICFEITETLAISNFSAAVDFISVLRGIGCHFALDDFGSGLSSFGYLKNLPVDYLKIDGMFVKDIVDNPIDYAMVKSINDIGHVMGMKTIAEFVENNEIEALLDKIGVDYVQGNSIGVPEAFDELIEQSMFTI